MKFDTLQLMIDRMMKVEVRHQSREESTVFLKERLEQLKLDGKGDVNEARFIEAILAKQMQTAN